MLRDKIRVDFVPGNAIQRAVVGMGIDPPKTGITHIRDPRAETVSQQPEKTKHNIRVGPGVGHDFSWVQLLWLVQQKGGQDQATTKRAGKNDPVQAGELILDEIVITLRANI